MARPNFDAKDNSTGNRDPIELKYEQLTKMQPTARHTHAHTRTHAHTHTHTQYESLCGLNEHIWDIQQRNEVRNAETLTDVGLTEETSKSHIKADCVSDIPV